MFERIEGVCNLEDCLGCGLCKSVCPKKAISISDESGFYRPIINDKCVGCHLCQKMCPINNSSRVRENLYSTPDTAYAAWCKNRNNHFASASGGIATLLLKTIIEEGGFAVGTWFNPEKQLVEHRIFHTTEEIELSRGSKYTNSRKEDIYKEAANLLQNKQGIFVGVPCEVYAMRQYLSTINKTTNRMFFVDLLCRGGASPLFFREHIKKVGKGKKLSNVTFRGGEYDCNICLYEGNKLVYRDAQFLDPYFMLFMRHTIYQQACFNCFFSTSERIGDLTLGDFWGLDETILSNSDVQGTNMIFINTNQGQKLLELVKDDIILYERPVQEAIDGNSTLHSATLKEEEYDRFWNSIRKKGFYGAIKEVYGIDVNKTFIKAKIRMGLKRIREMW